MKPEMRQDRDYAKLSHSARELFNGLVTLADDEGRFLSLTSVVTGHVFPYDSDLAALREWFAELRRMGSIVFYKVDQVPYGAFRHWARHQRINRPSPSELPDPPDTLVVFANGLVEIETDRGGSVWKQRAVHDPESIREFSRNVHGAFMEDSVNVHGGLSEPSMSRVRARAGGRRSDPVVVDLSNHLAVRVRANDPKFDAAKGTSVRWLNDMRLLLADRNGDADEIRRVVDWVQADEFERSNVLSPGKLRARFTALLLKADKATVATNGHAAASSARSIDEIVAADEARRAAARSTP